MHYRALPEAHRDAFHEIVSYAFNLENGPDFDERDEDRPWVREDRAVYDLPTDADVAESDLAPDDIRAVAGYYDFTTRLRDDWHSVGGISAVASPPETRRQGHVAYLLDEMLAEFREADVAFSALWPFQFDFYRHFGWAIIGHAQSLTIAPDELSGVVADPAGSYRSLEQADWEDLTRIYEQWADESFGVVRDELDWQLRFFDVPWRDVYAAGWEDDDGVLQAYCFYGVEKGDDGRKLTVYEHGYTDETARRQILRYVRDHDSQVSEVTLKDRRLTDLFETLEDPRAGELTSHPGPMIRVVDVVDAVEALSVPESAEGSVTVGVTDGRCDWNDGAFELRFAGGEATCEALDADAETDADLEIGAFSQLLTGCVPLSRLRHHDVVEIHHESAAATLAAAYPEETVYLREGF